MKRIFVLIGIIIFVTNLSFAQKNKESALQKYSRVKFKVQTIGDRVAGVNENYSQINVAEILKELKKSPSEKNSPYNITYKDIGCSTIYDYVSNATPQNIIQDPNNPNKIHVVCMSSPWGDPQPGFPNRRVKYWYSTDRGLTFTYVDNLGTRSGFPHIALNPSGVEMICFNSGTGSSEKVRWYLDAAAGLGSWTELYPALNPSYLYARSVYTNSVVNPVKFVSTLSSFDLDSVFQFGCTSVSPAPGTFVSPNFINAKPAECYFIARGDDGRIGIVYIANNILQPADIGDVYFIESTDNGTSFSNPTKIFDANISPTGDSLGAFRGISMVYLGNAPKVVFETVKQTSNGYYFPGAPANIRFWSNSLPGIDPNRSIVIVDTSIVPFRPYVSKGTNNDLFASLCRPTIGRSITVNSLHLSFMVPSILVGGFVDTNSNMNIWYSFSPNGGSNWMNPQKISPDTGLFKDWTYPSLSPTNDVSGTNFYFSFSALNDSIPGSYINHPANGQSNAKFMFSRGLSWYEPPEPPPPPVLISPPNGAPNILLNSTLIWSGGASSCGLQISLSQTFTSYVIDTVVGGSQYIVPLGKLNLNTTYYWRMHNSVGYPSIWWSLPWSFTTRTTGINTINSEIPKEYKLYQNYPNPFNPVTKIRFQIKDSRFVILRVYDILGKEVAMLVNEKLSPGKFEIAWNAFSLPSGMYFYKLETGNFTDVKKLVLIK
ncbi:MAG: T9SS type A sorting domain-containing protein [Ignavibacteria bacterium]